MTKERYMALADLQTLWTNQIKPSLPTKTEVNNKAAANHNHDTVYSKIGHLHSQYAEHYEVMAEQTRAMTKEAQLQGQIIRPVNMDTLTPSSTFTANQCVAINGVFYRAKQSTASFPVTLVIDNGQFVYNESSSGHKAYVIADGTLNSDWEVWSDSSIDFWREYFDLRLDSKVELTSEVSGYTVQELLEYVASLMAQSQE